MLNGKAQEAVFYGQYLPNANHPIYNINEMFS